MTSLWRQFLSNIFENLNFRFFLRGTITTLNLVYFKLTEAKLQRGQIPSPSQAENILSRSRNTLGRVKSGSKVHSMDFGRVSS